MSSSGGKVVAKKKKPNRNVFDITQFKKMIGKGLVNLWAGAVVDKKALTEEVKKIKDKVLAGSVKSIAMTGYVNGGVLYVFGGIERLFVINALSYSELKKAQLEIEIIVNQYPKLSKDEIAGLL